MSEVKTFFRALETQYDKQLPFVVYSRPINSIIKCWLQKDTMLHTTTNFIEQGFVFAPFDLKGSSSVLFPQNCCDYAVIEVSDLDLKPSINNRANKRDHGSKAHIKLVTKGIEAIRNNYLKKVVLSRVEKRSVDHFDPLETFKRLFNTYKKAMVYCWYHPKVGLWLGATPELLFKVEASQLTAVSLAGTQAYSADIKPQWTEKELQEQKIVTDFLVDQVAPFTTKTRISEVQSIRAGNLWHLKTRLISTVRKNANLKSIIEALHPTPAVCGFPKQQAKEFILEHEGYSRDYYTGFLGELNLKQIKYRNSQSKNVENNAYTSVKICSNFYVNLRCMQVKNNKAHIYVGGGVTKDSVPENEWEETKNKAQTISTILR